MEYAFDGCSSHYGSESGVQEDDPTPKPLRITKRAEWPSAQATSEHIHKPLPLRTRPDTTRAALQRDASVVRLRHSSEISSRASSTDYAAATDGGPQTTLHSPQSSAAAASQHYVAGPLSVRKQRQRGTTSSSTGTGSIVADGLRGNPLSYPPVGLTKRNLQQWNGDRAPRRSYIGRERPAERAKRIHNRAFTQQPYQKQKPFYLSSQQSGNLATSASTPFLSDDKARAISERVPRSNRAASIASQSTEIQQLEADSAKHSSFNRFLSRMMNGLGHKGSASQAATERGRSRKDSHGSSRSKRGTPYEAQQGRGRSSTTSSGATNTTMGTEFDLDATLASFPAPPKSTPKSPSLAFAAPSTPATSPLTPSTPFLPQVLYPPQEVTIIGAKLTIVPEIRGMTNNDGQSIFAAVEVEGVMNAAANPGYGSSDCRRLDVAVIVDNSYASNTYSFLKRPHTDAGY